jgi:TPP-dependent pyruvate/acetoin dehydrogenase alpha subunit
MLCTRIVDDYTWKLHTQGFIDFVASCRGHEAAQVGSAVCIEVGKDFTLPYYRDLGVVLTIGMTPHEVFRTYLQNRSPRHAPLPLTSLHDSSQGQGRIREAGAVGIVPCADPAPTIMGCPSPSGGISSVGVGLAPVSKTDRPAEEHAPFHHWAYHKHNTVTGPAPVATQLLHAAGIAFACKLRKASVVTVAYCGDGATTEPDFLEGLRFAAQHQLPVVFICEQASMQQSSGQAQESGTVGSRTGLAPVRDSTFPTNLSLPEGLTYRQVDGTDVVAVYQAMGIAMQHAREGRGPVLLEMHIVRSLPNLHLPACQETESKRPFILGSIPEDGDMSDPLIRCQHYLQAHDVWDDDWANQLYTRISAEIECAWRDVLHDILQSS